MVMGYKVYVRRRFKNNSHKWEVPIFLLSIGSRLEVVRNDSREIERYKLRQVVKYYNQRECNYKETFSSHVSTKDAFRVVTALVGHFDFDFHLIDVKTPFLNGCLNEQVYLP